MFTPNPFQQIRTLISDCALKVKQYLHVGPANHDIAAARSSVLTKSPPDAVNGADYPIALQCPVKQLPRRRSSQSKCRNMSFRLSDQLHRKIAREMQVLSGTRADFIRNAIDRALQDEEALLGSQVPSAMRGHDTRPTMTGLEQVPGIAILTAKRRKITFRLDDALLARICRRVPPGRRSDFIRNAVERALKQNAQERLHALHSQISWN